MNTLHIAGLIVSVIAGVYEVVVRVIPTVGNYSFLGKIINALKVLSDYLNITKK
jgi:uncharacterized secreted protein with C-terminal beta-propeller domain